MKYFALLLLLAGVYLVKRGFDPRHATIGTILIGGLGLLCLAAGLITFLVLIFLAL
jgi:hypothetical protein